MPFTKAAAPADAYPKEEGEVNGWKFRSTGNGQVFVGTANVGPFKKFSFWLQRYGDQAPDIAACVLGEIEDRNTPERVQKIGYETPCFGPLCEGTKH